VYEQMDVVMHKHIGKDSEAMLLGTFVDTLGKGQTKLLVP